MEPDELLARRFLFHTLAAVDFVALNQSTTTPSLRRQELEAIEIALPPLPEQHRIVDVLEDHLSRLQAAESMLTSARQKSTSLRARAVEAVLDSPTDSAQDFAAERLVGISEMREERVSARRQKPAPPAFQLDLPSGWVTASVDELCWQIQYGTSTKTRERAADTDVPVLRMGNIQGGEIDAGDLKYIADDDPSVRDLILEDGDLLFNRTNSAELVGKTAVFEAQLPQATFASYLIRCRVVPGVSARWISLVANSSIGRRYIESVMTQQVGQANVNGTKLAAMPIPIADAVTERTLLEQILDLRQSGVRLSRELSACFGRSTALRAGLLRAAFSGELVDQDPNDEPADVALDRIRNQPKPARKRAAPRSS